MPSSIPTEQKWTATPEAIRRLKRAHFNLIRVRAASLNRYYSDPVAFLHDCITWPEGQSTTPYQEDVLAAIPEHKRVTQRGPHGLGKSTSHALAVLWFSLTRDAAGVDWKCPTTAGGWHQLEQYLWPEIHKWAARLRWDKLGRDPLRQGKELLRLNLQLAHGRAFAVASNVPARIEGAHADSLMFIFDEAKIIPPGTFDAAEGAFSGGADCEAFAFCSSTPGEPVGRFYDLHYLSPDGQPKKGFEKWWRRHVTITEAIRAGRTTEEWRADHEAMWGPDSALYHNRVLGEFYSTDESSIIPLRWLEAAAHRWAEHAADARRSERSKDYRRIGDIDRIGLDVANAGDDKTVLALITGDRVHELRTRAKLDTTAVVNLAVEALSEHPGATVVVDADGVGVGVYDGLRNKGLPVRAFHAAGATDKRDKSGQLEFLNVRAAAWWQLREMLDPRNTPTLELPNHDMLMGDLSAPKYAETERGKIKVEAKDDVKKRLGRSPDHGDAVVMGLWRERVRKPRRMTYAGRAA